MILPLVFFLNHWLVISCLIWFKRKNALKFIHCCFRSATGENWHLIMKACFDDADCDPKIKGLQNEKCGSTWLAITYFCSFIFLCMFLVSWKWRLKCVTSYIVHFLSSRDYSCLFFSLKIIIIVGGMCGRAVRALAFHHCDPRSILDRSGWYVNWVCL